MIVMTAPPVVYPLFGAIEVTSGLAATTEVYVYLLAADATLVPTGVVTVMSHDSGGGRRRGCGCGGRRGHRE